jgi:hypothetical protein
MTAAGKVHRRKRVKVRIRVHFPKHKTNISKKLKRHFDESSSTQGIETSIYDSSNNLLQKSAADISLTSTNCTGNAASRSCNYEIAAPPGTNETFTFRTFDQPPNANGNIPAAAAQIGAGTQSPINVVEGTTNTSVDVALGGVLASIGLSVSPSSLHTLIQTNATLQVDGRDADGNAIIGTFVDGGGNIVTINFSFNSNPSGSWSFSPASITAPPIASPPTYPLPGVLVQGNTGTSGSGGAYVISASPSGGNAPTGTVTLNVVDPTVQQISDSNLSTTTGLFGGIVYVPSQNALFYTYRAGTGGISEYSTTGGSVTSFSAPGAGVTGGLASDTSHNDLVVAGPANLFTMNYSGNYTSLCGAACAGSGSKLTFGSGSAWYGNGTNLIATSVTIPTPTSAPIGATVGSGIAIDNTADQVVWIANTGTGGNVLAYDPVNATLNSIPMPNGETAFDVIKDAQGMIWVTTSPVSGNISGHLVEINPVTQMASITQQTNYGQPWYISQDPVQQNVYWYDFSYSGEIGIGRLDTLAGTNNQYPFPCCQSPQQPGALVAAGGYVYMVVDGQEYLARVSP